MPRHYPERKPPPQVSVSCARCGQPMVMGHRRNTKRRYLRCSMAPICAYSCDLPLYFELLEQGAKQLPGFEEL